MIWFHDDLDEQVATSDQLQNVPGVDNSLKWAGGGFLSTVGDLLQFGNAMLYSYQKVEEDKVKVKDVVFTASPYSSVNDTTTNQK